MIMVMAIMMYLVGFIDSMSKLIYKRWWEAGMRTEILEFHGTLQPEKFLDWLATVEEVLEFKGVPKNQRVPLVVTRFRDRAMA